MQIHTLQGYIQNIYLVEYEHGLMLLDGCSRADVSKVCRFIADTLKRPLHDLKTIIVTHMHPDHAGGSHRLRSITGCKIYSHPKAPRWYRGIAGRAAHITDIVLALWVAGRIGRKKRQIWYTPILKPDGFLTDEQYIKDFEDWQVLHTPGHTDHDLSLYHAKTNKVYIADLIVQVKGQFVPPYPVCHPNQYQRSLSRVAGLENATLFFAHAKPQVLDNAEFHRLKSIAPRRPKNHWYSTKSRIHRALKLPFA